MSGPFDDPGAMPPGEGGGAPAELPDVGEFAQPATDGTFADPFGGDPGAVSAPPPPPGFTGIGDLPPADGAAQSPPAFAATLPEAAPSAAVVAARHRDALPPAAKVVGRRTPQQLVSTVGRRYLWVVGVIVIASILIAVMPSARGTTTASSSGSAAGGTAAPSGITPATAQYASGTTVGGVSCGSGVRQVSWSAYAPPCQPAWHGDNGGNTYRGVTSNTITLSYRSPTTAQLSEIYGIVPADVVGANPQAIETMQAYIAAFNKDFELYGRHVVLVPFTGKSDFVDEDLGQDQALAQEDAVTVATSVKAFADDSPVSASAIYANELATQGVVSFSLYEQPQSFYEGLSPYEYTPGPNCTKAAQLTGAVLGGQLGGLPASFAGPGTRGQTRTYGIIYPFGPQAKTCADEDVAALEHYGQKVTTTETVKFDLSDLIQSADAAVAKMKATGVTTIILNSTDPITPKFYLEAADTDHYYPEWWFQSYFPSGQTNNDALSQQFPADQAAHIIGMGTATLPQAQQEAMKAFRLGNQILGRSPTLQPVPTYFWEYTSLLAFFDGLQLAGPDLTPTTFKAGMGQIPNSTGMLGQWDGSTGPYDPGSGLQLVHYDDTARSPLNGQLGAYVACDDGRIFSVSSGGPSVQMHKQQSPATCKPS